MERDLNSVRHVFVGFVEGRESGIRNAEFATLSMSPVGAYCIVLYFLCCLKLDSHYNNYFIFNFSIQDIEQNVSETLACCSKVSSASTYIPMENKLSKQQTTRYSSIIQLLNRFQTFICHIVSTISSETEG